MKCGYLQLEQCFIDLWSLLQDANVTVCLSYLSVELLHIYMYSCTKYNKLG